MKQATKRFVSALSIVAFAGAMTLNSVLADNLNTNESELVIQERSNGSAFAGASEATILMLQNTNFSEDSNNVDPVGVPLEECEMTIEGTILVPEFEEYDIYVNTSFLNVREKPSTDSTTIGKLNINDKVTVIDEIGDVWMVIEYNGTKGYISSEYTQETPPENDTYNNTWTGAKLNKHCGSVQGPSGKETYYNLNMAKCIYYMQCLGYYEHYWVRSDGAKMYGKYVMCAANLKVHPKGSLVETSLGTALVVDTGEFATSNPNQVDICVTW